MDINIKKLKEKLLAEKEILVNELSALGRLNPETDRWEATPNIEETRTPEADENDLADHDEDFEERTATLSALASRYGNVQKALKKIENKTYGICETCNKPIEQDRLEANPAARNCKKHME